MLLPSVVLSLNTDQIERKSQEENTKMFIDEILLIKLLQRESLRDLFENGLKLFPTNV